MANQRKTGGREELDALWAVTNSLVMLLAFSTLDDPAIGNATTAGQLRTTASADYRVANRQYTKASTDNLWDLSGEAATGAAEYRAYWLLLDSAGAASFAAGSEAASEADALKALPDLDGTKAVLGVYIAGPSTNFAAALAAQGTIYDGIPDGASCGVPRQTYSKPAVTTLVAP